MTKLPVPDPARLARLREALLAAGYTADGCLDLLGPTGYAALARNEAVPALRATRGGTPLETLVRLFLLQQPVPYAAAAAALPVDEALADGWLLRDGEEVRATVDVRPYANEVAGLASADAWVVSDLGCAVGGAGGIGAGGSAGAVDRRELVLGVGGASTTLANLAVRRPVRAALDLGTGSGVQALHAARHAQQVTATDLNPRALAFARLTLALSGFTNTDTAQGSLFEPVGQRKFDLIVSNPPFVISPGSRFVYRDGGMAGDDLCRSLVRGAAEHLEPGGYCQLLANWQHVKGEDWHDRLAGWVAGTGLDAWVVQREVQDVAQYAELWLRDGGDHLTAAADYQSRYNAWLDAFEAAQVEGIGFGWITLRAGGADRPTVRIEEWPHTVEQPLGPHIEQWFARQDFLRTHDDAALLSARFVLADEVVQEQIGAPGAEDPEHVVLRHNRGMRRATKVDTVGAGFTGVCDGTLAAGEIIDAIAQLLGEDRVRLRDRVPESLRMLVEQGFIEPTA
ncbi:methylase of polypeptide subunit release factors [Kitasatospora sp. MAP12-15]|uniref:class I SAM-dependent methyltransferase n=1 Tax=unclassified Kitasatospora TaxID=2633591 RepID=UPI0024768329|nr:class I SAM-dependent methyltransferase [Kitasatospora sp. MAP12-44]MDH6111455.1 methylase of polypeptide subunit release factors [Kitasatospora sp. MAP12-44]